MLPAARRSRPGLRALLISLCLLVPRAAPAGPARAKERRGEAFTFRLRLGPVEGGRARLAIAPPVRDGQRRLIHVVGQAEAVGIAKVFTQLRDDYKLVIDADTLTPQRMEVSETGLRLRTVIATLTGRRADISISKPEGKRRVQGELPSEPRDPVAALLVMRAARLAEGDRLDMVVLDGAAFYRGWVEVLGREPLQMEAGPRPAIRLRCRGERINPDGTAAVPARPVREALLWLSDDEDRVPLRMEGETDLGKASVELTSHEAPRRRLPPPALLPGVKTTLHPG